MGEYFAQQVGGENHSEQGADELDEDVRGAVDIGKVGECASSFSLMKDDTKRRICGLLCRELNE